MSTKTTETAHTTLQMQINAHPGDRRDLKTQILHANEKAYAKQLERFRGREDMWQDGDVYYPNLPKQAIDITVGDLTGREDEFTLEKNGFCLAKQSTESMKTTEDIQDTKKVKESYYGEMEAWLREL